MSDDGRRDDPHDEDAEYRRWREEREQDSEASASVTFMELMRRAASSYAPPTESPAAPSGTAQESAPAAREVEVDTAPPPAPPIIPPPDDDADDDGEEDAAPPPPPRRRRRTERRRARASSSSSALGGCLRSFIIILAAAGLTATIFTWWTPNEFIAPDARRGLSAAIATQTAPAATTAPTPNWAKRIGIVSGHRGPENDPGAVCPDGLTEAEINFNVAQMVVSDLRERGYTVDLLDEFDPRLTDYQASALVSIHANTCQPFGSEQPSGFLIAAAAARISARGNDDLLVECIAREYAAQTALERRQGLTLDMTDYHTFREIHPLTPAAIIELGFMLADRALLTDQPDLLAGAITDGVLCFLEPTPLGA